MKKTMNLSILLIALLLFSAFASATWEGKTYVPSGEQISEKTYTSISERLEMTKSEPKLDYIGTQRKKLMKDFNKEFKTKLDSNTQPAIIRSITINPTNHNTLRLRGELSRINGANRPKVNFDQEIRLDSELRFLERHDLVKYKIIESSSATGTNRGEYNPRKTLRQAVIVE